MENILFYYSGWILWILITFHWKKGKKRTFWAAFVLIMLAGHQWVFNFSHHVMVNGTYLLTFALAFIFPISFRTSIRLKIVILGISFSFLYASLRFVEWYDPVLFLYGRSSLYTILFFFLLVVLLKQEKERIAVLFLFLVFGELLASWTLWPLTGELILGRILFLNQLFMLLLCIFVYSSIQQLLSYISQHPLRKSVYRSPYQGSDSPF